MRFALLLSLLFLLAQQAMALSTSFSRVEAGGSRTAPGRGRGNDRISERGRGMGRGRGRNTGTHPWIQNVNARKESNEIIASMYERLDINREAIRRARTEVNVAWNYYAARRTRAALDSYNDKVADLGLQEKLFRDLKACIEEREKELGFGTGGTTASTGSAGASTSAVPR